jgi:hypothetical protein
VGGYGYRRQAAAGRHLDHGDLIVNDDEAQVIERIFHDYDEGNQLELSRSALNNKVSLPQIPVKSGVDFSTIRGNWKRGTGILNSELYIGMRVCRSAALRHTS